VVPEGFWCWVGERLFLENSTVCLIVDAMIYGCLLFSGLPSGGLVGGGWLLIG